MKKAAIIEDSKHNGKKHDRQGHAGSTIGYYKK